ncbi:MAG: DUF4336 domain-containing protein [Maritimibacter sp.]
MSTGYEPLNRPKPWGEDIWVMDGPAIRFYGMPFSTRATIVRLADGGLWVHSPILPTEPMLAHIKPLGEIRHLIAPNWIHYAYIAEWQARFPEAVSWAAPGVEERAKSRGMEVHFDHALRQEPPEAWAGEIDQMIVRGSKIHREAVFFHRKSKSLILTDLIENFEPEKIGIWMRLVGRLAGIIAPNGKAPIDMRQTFRGGRAELREDVERMIGWAPERIILAHGACIESDGVAELKRAFRWAL